MLEINTHNINKPFSRKAWRQRKAGWKKSTPTQKAMAVTGILAGPTGLGLATAGALRRRGQGKEPSGRYGKIILGSSLYTGRTIHHRAIQRRAAIRGLDFMDAFDDEAASVAKDISGVFNPGKKARILFTANKGLTLAAGAGAIVGIAEGLRRVKAQHKNRKTIKVKL